jgi:hypothetical protein
LQPASCGGDGTAIMIGICFRFVVGAQLGVMMSFFRLELDSLALFLLFHTQGVCLRHGKSEIISGHMAQVRNCDCIMQRRIPLGEGCFVVCVHTTAFDFRF